MPETNASGVRISYTDCGTGEPPLLFLPGWVTDFNVFDDIVDGTCTENRSIAMDWRGHGRSERDVGDFGLNDMLSDAMAVIQAAGLRQVVPVALSHAGWVAIQLRRRLGDRVPRLVLVDWIVTDPTAEFREILAGLQSPKKAMAARDKLFGMWLNGVQIRSLTQYALESVASYDSGMWARLGREVAACYRREGSPLKALASLKPPPPVLHIYAQPSTPEYLAAQQAFASKHPWFRVHQLTARTHFPMFEVPQEIVSAIRSFASKEAEVSRAAGS